MAYYIHYDRKCVKTTISENKHAVFPNVLAALFLVIAIFIGALFCSGGYLYEFLLPGDPCVTELALSAFAENIGNGLGFMESAEIFCRMILDNA